MDMRVIISELKHYLLINLLINIFHITGNWKSSRIQQTKHLLQNSLVEKLITYSAKQFKTGVNQERFECGFIFTSSFQRVSIFYW